MSNKEVCSEHTLVDQNRDKNLKMTQWRLLDPSMKQMAYRCATVLGSKFYNQLWGAQWSERAETPKRAYVCNNNIFSSFLETYHCNFRKNIQQIFLVFAWFFEKLTIVGKGGNPI